MVAEGRFGPDGAVHVADAAQFAATGLDAQCPQRGDTAGHDSFATGLVHGPGPGFDDDGLQAGERGMDGSGQTGRPTAGHQYVDHAGAGVVGLAAAVSVRFSQRMRTVSRTALSTVNTAAVIQAVWTSGRATPSATTAT